MNSGIKLHLQKLSLTDTNVNRKEMAKQTWGGWDSNPSPLGLEHAVVTSSANRPFVIEQSGTTRYYGYSRTDLSEIKGFRHGAVLLTGDELEGGGDAVGWRSREEGDPPHSEVGNHS